jgi:hypothetical protein
MYGIIMSNTEILHIVYGNNHFEHVTMYNQNTNVVKYAYNCNVNNQTSKNFETKKNENNVQHKRKRFNWSFELNNALLKMVKAHLQWIEQ